MVPTQCYLRMQISCRKYCYKKCQITATSSFAWSMIYQTWWISYKIGYHLPNFMNKLQVYHSFCLWSTQFYNRIAHNKTLNIQCRFRTKFQMHLQITVNKQQYTISRVTTLPFGLFHAASTRPRVNLGRLPDDESILNQLPNVLTCTLFSEIQPIDTKMFSLNKKNTDKHHFSLTKNKSNSSQS